MHLKYCSITGADDDVDIKDLSALAREYPFVEWAILLLPDLAGKARCPSYGWIARFIRDYKGRHTAMHLCDQALLDFVANQREVMELMAGFWRIQLNLRFGDVEGKYDIKELIARVKENPACQFIVQYTPDKAHILPLFEGITNHALLFDASAGQGLSPDAWPAPIKGHFCGYAGGINPNNVIRNLELIARAVGDGETWIDMESGVRTDDQFDIGKARKILEAAKVYA